jgi:hypothetical protein
MSWIEFGRRWPSGWVLLVTLIASAWLGTTAAHTASQAKAGAAPSIKITTVPPRGEGPDKIDLIAGTVTGVNVKECKVVIFAKTNVWWVQPTAAEPYTSIEQGGKWEADIHLGYEYAALLVKTSYKAPPTLDVLPGVGGNVLAIDRVRAKQGRPGDE